MNDHDFRKLLGLAVEIGGGENGRVVTERRAVTEGNVEGQVDSGINETTAGGEGLVGGACVGAVGQARRSSVRETLDRLRRGREETSVFDEEHFTVR